jgi:uncharacterized SAM-binding protein YcdF (DUF218 family)
VAQTAARLPDATFAFIGPPQCDLSRIEACHNVALLGAKPHHELPHYVREFDVGIVPYRLSDYTANVYPTKLNEYLAMGVPVVASDLLEIRRFNAEHGDIVAIAGDSQAFAQAVGAALADGQPAAVARRIEVARHNSWDTRIAQMSRLVAQAVDERAAHEEQWEERLRRAYRRARRRTAEVVLGVVAAYLLLFQTPLIWGLASPLKIASAPRPADCIVVFAGGVGESGQAGGGYQERVKQAVDLYRAGYARELIFSSGFVFAFREAEVMQALAISNGVPAAAVYLETHATNTYENVLFSQRLMADHGWQSALLVSSPYHMRRAVMTWHKAAPRLVVVPTPVPVSQFYLHQYGASLAQIRGIAWEYAAILMYWWRGWM